MTSSISFLNDTKIETVNAKFATSILAETITKLSLLQCAERLSIPEVAVGTKKFTTDLANIKRLFYQIVSDLKDHQNFTDFSGVSVAQNESNFLIEYSANKAKCEELCAALHELEVDVVNFRMPTITADESIVKCAVQNRFIKNWEKSRRDQNDHFNRIQIDELQNFIDNYSRKIKLEERCIVEIETYSLLEMDMHKAESIRWSEKFDSDLNRTEIDIQMATAELDALKMSYEKLVETIRFRQQEMVDFVALKVERDAQKDSDLMKLISLYRNHLLARCKIFRDFEDLPFEPVLKPILN